MGCTTSQVGIGLDGSGAKAWLKIEDVAATVQAFPRDDGAKGLTVVAAGMDKYGLLGKLERAFRHRGFGIESGEWAVKGSLFHATFLLAPPAPDVSGEPKFASESSDPGFQRQITPMCNTAGSVLSVHTEMDGDLCTPAKAYQMVPRPVVPYLKVDVEHTMGEDLHIGLLSIVHDFSGNAIRGMYHTRTVTDALNQVEHDSFWIDCADMKLLIDTVFSSPNALQQRLHAVRRSLEEEVEKATVLSSSSKLPMVEANTTDSLLNALRIADRKALQKLMIELPAAVMERVSKTPYKIKPSSWGHQIEGYQKYMGAGIMLQSSTSDSKAPVLQFTTLFVQNKDAVNAGFRRRSLAAMRDRQYGEFTNSIDVNRRRFTVERVFLNKVCPAGHNIGAFASAEQLFAPVWEKGAYGTGELLPVHKIQEIKLSDVVNWNTYAVMSIALSEKKIREECFGEHFEASLNEELRAAKLTRSACKTLPLVQILLRTQLGRFIQRILDLWYKWSSVCLTCISAEVTFKADYEFIAGEARSVMDVVCQVQVEYSATLDLKSVSTPTKSYGHPRIAKNPGEKPPQPDASAPASTADAALSQWMEKIKASFGDMDHGFKLGSTSLHDMADVAARPFLKALNCAMMELQRERAWSCMAVADDLNLNDETAGGMCQQRGATDKAFVDVLHLAESSIIREVSTSLILLRSVVDQNLASQKPWEDRYKMICTEARTFNTLIGNLVEWLAGACKMAPDIEDASAQSICLFCYFSEQLGRERAFVLARGRARSADSGADKDGMRNVVLMSATRNLIGDLLQLNSRALFRQLEEAEVRFLTDETHDPQDWYKAITVCMEAIRNLIDELIDGRAEQPDFFKPVM